MEKRQVISMRKDGILKLNRIQEIPEHFVESEGYVNGLSRNWNIDWLRFDQKKKKLSRSDQVEVTHAEIEGKRHVLYIISSGE